MTRIDSNATSRPAAKRARATAGRPRAKDNPTGVSPREGILKVASELFALKGYEGTTMAEVADAVGIRGPSLYYHFKDKADMLRALAEVGLGDALRDSETLRRDHGHSAPARLYHLMHELVVRLKTSPYEMSVLFDPAFRTKQFKDVNQRVARWMADLESIVEEGIENQDFLLQDAPTAAYTLRGIVQTAIPQAGLNTSFDAHALADYVCNFALRALLRDQGRLLKVQREFSTMQLAKASPAKAPASAARTSRPVAKKR